MSLLANKKHSSSLLPLQVPPQIILYFKQNEIHLIALDPHLEIAISQSLLFIYIWKKAKIKKDAKEQPPEIEK